MTGAFSRAFETFASQGVPAIPTQHERPAVPMVRHPDKFGIRASRKLVQSLRYAQANAAIWAGHRSGVTVLDIDTPDVAVVQNAINTFGDTPLKVTTPSGGIHLYFLHQGERRSIRPFGAGVPLDILGSGIVVVPPSERRASNNKAAGVYRVVEGDFSLLPRLPTMRRHQVPQNAHSDVRDQNLGISPLDGMRDGDGRDNALFRVAIRFADTSETEEELVRRLVTANGRMAEPMSDAAVRAKARSAWNYKMNDRLILPGSHVAQMDSSSISVCSDYPPAFLLLAYLRSFHARGHLFAVVPDAVGPRLKMAKGTARTAREFLVVKGYLELRKRGGQTRNGRSPNQYRLAP